MRVRWAQHAVDQLDEHIDAIAETDAARAREVLERLIERIGALADLPWLAPPWRDAGDPTIRRLVVDQHVVFYRVVEDHGVVIVLSVRHGRERPPDPDDVR